MTKSKLGDLNDHLFAALDRLGAEDLTPERIESEARRAEAIVKVADQITENARTRLAGAKLFAEHGAKILPHLPQVGGGAGGPAQIEGQASK